MCSLQCFRCGRRQEMKLIQTMRNDDLGEQASMQHCKQHGPEDEPGVNNGDVILLLAHKLFFGGLCAC